jgi:tRNA (adenine22-N1)-methyltransferase
MKNIKRFIILMLVFAVVSALLVSCGETEKAVATYGENNHIYAEDSDFSDFYHLYTYYHKIESTDDKMSSAEYNTILRDAVKTTVEMRLLEDEISRRGYSVDMEKVEEAANIDKNVFEKAYPGGFSAFCEHWGVSADVFVTLNKFEALCEVAKESFFTTEKVTEAEAEVYYEKNEDDFVRKPHYEIKELYLQVMDGVEKESVFNDAKVYIGMVNTGRSWENVFNTAIIKYNLENSVELRLSDGLREIKPEEVSEIVFAGMGGTLISEKLKECPWVKSEKHHFIFQPQSKAEDLRKFLYENGFEINREVAVSEGRRYYIAFDAYYKGEVKPFSLSDCFIGKLPKTPEAKMHLTNQLSRLEKKYNALKAKSDGNDIKALEALINDIKGFVYG